MLHDLNTSLHILVPDGPQLGTVGVVVCSHPGCLLPARAPAVLPSAHPPSCDLPDDQPAVRAFYAKIGHALGVGWGRWAGPLALRV